MDRSRHDNFHFLQGLVMALVWQAAIATLGGVIWVFMVALAPAGLEDNLQAIGGKDLEGNLMVAALIQTLIWGGLPYFQLVSRRLGRRMMYTMAATTLILFLTVLISIW